MNNNNNNNNSQLLPNLMIRNSANEWRRTIVNFVRTCPLVNFKFFRFVFILLLF